MKTHHRFLIIYLLILIIILPYCATVHETSSIQPKMSLTEILDSMKEAVKDTKQHPFFKHEKVVRDVAIYEDGFKLINMDNTERYFAFKDIIDPSVGEVAGLIFVKFQRIDGENLVFTNSKSAIMFCDALYNLKHIDIKQEREREREDCLRQIRQTPIDLILAGTTVEELKIPCSDVARDSQESVLNDILIEWKSKGFRERLQKSSSSQLSDLVVMLEKGILKLDLKAKQFKDAADEDARQVKMPGSEAPAKKAPGALPLAHVLEQRKTILMVILGSVKQAAVQRATSGG